MQTTAAVETRLLNKQRFKTAHPNDLTKSRMFGSDVVLMYNGAGKHKRADPDVAVD